MTSVTSVPDMSLIVMVSAPPSASKSTASTSLRSITTLAMSRVNRARPPLAESVMFSATLAPLKSIVSKPSWPSRVSLSSPGFQTKVSSPAPISAVSLPSPPLIRSSPSLPRITSSPRPPLIVSCHGAGLEAGRIDDVVATKAVERQPVAGFVEEHVRRGLEAEHLNSAGVAGDTEHVGTVGRVRP